MISPSPEIKLFIAVDTIDMRKSIDGLLNVIANNLLLNPQDKSIFIFHNHQRNKVKMLYWDKNGFILVYKRLEKGRFRFPKSLGGTCYEIDADQLQWLLAGFDFMRFKEYPELNFSHYL